MNSRPVRKPLNLSVAGCSPTSSNCVIWQGPDIPFLNLCKGATVTHVVYELAMEVLNIMEQLDPANYNLECIDLKGCPPETFQELFQIILCQVGQLQQGLPCKLSVNISTDLKDYTANIVGTPNGAVTYLWSLQGIVGNPSITGDPTSDTVGMSFVGEGLVGALLTVVVTDASGCTATASYLASEINS
jgi:hypothetical protein